MASSNKTIKLTESFEEHLQNILEQQKHIQITSSLSDDTEMWQIGSKNPPRTCLCCGSRFDDTEKKRRGPYENMPYLYVCQSCWSTPHLFFPDKVLADCGECWLPPGVTEHIHPGSGRRGTERKKRAY